ncbi:unnamed protein product [Spirodela intermedia]|uniref:Uncharacterized protein n=1 Tax=Spirodela intermedia TaxID=51605 RepID=A0A7I8LEH7_SPIIN|nr:unnamed protein product [Spirodela intermedia]
MISTNCWFQNLEVNVRVYPISLFSIRDYSIHKSVNSSSRTNTSE